MATSNLNSPRPTAEQSLAMFCAVAAFDHPHNPAGSGGRDAGDAPPWSTALPLLIAAQAGRALSERLRYLAYHGQPSGQEALSVTIVELEDVVKRLKALSLGG